MSVLKSKSGQFLFMRASTHLCGSSFLFPKIFNALSVDELVSFGLVVIRVSRYLQRITLPPGLSARWLDSRLRAWSAIFSACPPASRAHPLCDVQQCMLGEMTDQAGVRAMLYHRGYSRSLRSAVIRRSFMCHKRPCPKINACTNALFR